MKNRIKNCQQVSFSVYLERLEGLGLSPNFWCSEEYVMHSGWRTFQSESDTLYVVDDENNSMLPSIGRDSDGTGFWAGFSGIAPVHDTVPGWSFLDLEFIYNPYDFNFIDGSHWVNTKKNLRWAIEDVKEPLQLVVVKAADTLLIDSFLMDWVASNDTENIFDPEVIVKYMYEGEHRHFLRGVITGKVYGILAWDKNYKYVNFRYCLIMSGIRGLSDTARVCFHRYIARVFPGTLVNDGGALGNPGLERYKKRLNPIHINLIYSKEII